ncbi:MAG TPA: cupin domain-containing protein [bacterium]|nr:cupin domain-containing protein [bacterium]
MPRHRHVVHREEVPPVERVQGQRFAFTGRRLGAAAQAQRLGCSLYQVPPGKTGFPHHRHHANEEGIYILTGQGTLRLDDERVPVGPGDYIALPPGGPAHQLLNTGSAVLEYLCFSTMISPEVVEYPDSNKVAALAGTFEKPLLRAIYRKGDTVDYMEGED